MPSSQLSTIAPIVSADWLHANRSSVTVVDSRAYLDDRDGYTNYLTSHIAGAVFVDLDQTTAGAPGPIVGRHPLPDPTVFAEGLGAVGIDEKTAVIAYDDLGGMIASRLVWMLRAMGQPAALLDGGWQAWQAAHPELVESGNAQPDATPQVVSCAVRSMPAAALADADEVAAHLQAGGVVVDSRAAPRFAGEVEPVDAKAGHVPGAINLAFAGNLVTSGTDPQVQTFLAADKLRERFEQGGVSEQTIVYCGSGVSACHNVLAMERAGLDVPRVYVGSWSGWSSTPGRPVATGLD